MTDQAIHFDSSSSMLSKVLNGVDKSTRIDAQLDVEVNKIAFHILVDGDSAVISFGSFSDALVLYQMFAQYIYKANGKNLLFRKMLRNLNMTVYVQNRHIGIVGPNANPILSRLFKIASYFMGKDRK